MPNYNANYYNNNKDSIALVFDTGPKDMVITGDFNLNFLHITFRSLISLKTVKIPEKINAT